MVLRTVCCERVYAAVCPQYMIPVVVALQPSTAGPQKFDASYMHLKRPVATAVAEKLCPGAYLIPDARASKIDKFLHRLMQRCLLG